MSWGWLVPVVMFFMIFGGAQAVVNLVEGRRRYKLELKREERLIAEAKAKELEREQQRRELEYREALLELERFDRREGLPAQLRPPDG